MNSTPPNDLVRALSKVQALDIMWFRPPRGDSIARFRAEKGGPIAGFLSFFVQSVRNGAESAIFDNFEDFYENYQKH